MKGQILPDTPFGIILTALALQSETIVETGSLTGEGSTACLALGLARSSQRLICIEVCRDSAAECAARYAHDRRVTVLHGSVAPCPVWFDHPDPNARDWFNGECGLVASSPVIDRLELPKPIDLLLLDGGEFTSDDEFKLLAPLARTIALDDTRTFKHSRARAALLADSAWRVVFDQIDRNGWLIATRR